MRIVPDSTITLYGNVDIDNGEQLVFSSRQHQNAYFQSKIVRASTPCTMVRKTGALRVEIPGSVIATCNYLSFVNPSFDNKTIYARIIDYDYINNECVEISYLIDFWQTWMFDVQFEDSYIEREHLSVEDAVKANTNPYDPTIFEFRTGENLPISKDLEQLTYEIDDSSNYDGYLLTEALEYVANVDGTLGVLIKLANIDFANLDTASSGNSLLFANYLSSLIPIDTQTHKPSGGGVGFYWLTSEMGTYLNTHYPDKVLNNYACGTDWVYNGDAVTPFLSSKYHPGYCWIYDPNGADFISNCGHMGTLFQILTQYKAEAPEETIIDLSIVPNNLMFLASRQVSGTPITAGQVTAKTKLNVSSKKLMRYPFSYLRVISPNGDVKELHYENFKDVQDGYDLCKIGALMDITDRPTLIMAPMKYKMNGLAPGDINILEGLTFDQFPTMPYTIDAFTAQVAAVANYTIGNRTVDNAADMAATDTATNKTSQNITLVQKALGAASSGAASAAGLDGGLTYNDPSIGAESGVSGARLGGSSVGAGLGIAGAAAATAGMYSQGAAMDMARKKFEAQRERWMSADSALNEGDGSAIAAQLNLTKPAYACDKYIPSNGIGVINFSQMSFCDIVILRVKLSDEILAVYDNWFKHYGYTSGRCGIPRVVNYSHGGSSGHTDEELPEWVVVNGKESTYIKTLDCKIIYSMLPVASFIKNMFDSGVRMIKGDLT